MRQKRHFHKDDKPPCDQCRHHVERKLYPEASILHRLCTHPSALRLNGGVWAASIVRDVCLGRRFELKR